MPVFISHSHQDKDFVDKLAAQLILHKARVWVDRWEIKVGESLIDRVQMGIEGSGALIVVLSKAFCESEWCRKELNSGIIRELQEKNVFVLPVLLEDCKMPPFLQDKKYADFRADFDHGISDLLIGLASIDNLNQGRVENSDFNVDWSIDWFYIEEKLAIRLTVILHDKHQPYSCLLVIVIVGDEAATARYKDFEKEGFDWLQRLAILEAFNANCKDEIGMAILLEDQFEQSRNMGFTDSNLGLSYSAHLTGRRLGKDTGLDVLLDVRSIFGEIRSSLMVADPKNMSDADRKRFFELKKRIG